MVNAQPDASIKRLVGGTSALEVIICTFVRLCLRLRLLLLLVVIRVWMPQAVYRLPSLRLALFLLKILHVLALLLLIAIDGLVVEADAEALLLPLLLLVLLYALLIVALFVLVLVAILSLLRYTGRPTGITAARLLRLLRLPRESLPPTSRRTHPPRCDCREATV